MDSNLHSKQFFQYLSYIYFGGHILLAITEIYPTGKLYHIVTYIFMNKWIIVIIKIYSYIFP